MTVPLPDRFKQFPRDLASRSRTVRLGPDVPTLLAHPDWKTPAPVALWMHGRTANKELDPGRYLRWIRAGVAACAIDLPGHGERSGHTPFDPRTGLDAILQAVGEIDSVLESLADPAYHGVFDLDRIAIGGMSMGGIVALRRLCDPHTFTCAAVEGTTGWLEGLYFPQQNGLTPGEARPPPWIVDHNAKKIAQASAAAHLSTFRPIPMLAMHSEADQMLPFAVEKGFILRLRAHYAERHAPESLIEFKSWPHTGAPQEHIGFGRYSNDAKNLQTAFLAKHLQAIAPSDT